MKNQFEVLYTRQKTQKTKTWHDGVVVIDNLNGVRRISLYKIDENGCRGELVDAFSSYSREINISKINFPGHLIEFVAEIQEESGSKETVSVLKSSGDSYSGIVNVQPENYCQNENTQKCIARPFKTPL
ncbi:putative ABC-transporter [Cryptosporidium canis]|nr:putative ABC-transporter [Cryptosporidium canis]